jgi:hypothetical protein
MEFQGVRQQTVIKPDKYRQLFHQVVKQDAASDHWQERARHSATADWFRRGFLMMAF